MQKPDLIRFRHMLDAAMEAVSFAKGKNKDDLKTDRMLVLSLIKAIEMIGEAASKVSAEARQAHPELPWTDIISMRNRLIHVYFDINLDIVWDTVTDDLPPLISAVEQVIARHV